MIFRELEFINLKKFLSEKKRLDYQFLIQQRWQRLKYP